MTEQPPVCCLLGRFPHLEIPEAVPEHLLSKGIPDFTNLPDPRQRHVEAMGSSDRLSVSPCWTVFAPTPLAAYAPCCPCRSAMGIEEGTFLLSQTHPTKPRHSWDLLWFNLPGPHRTGDDQNASGHLSCWEHIRFSQPRVGLFEETLPSVKGHTPRGWFLGRLFGPGFGGGGRGCPAVFGVPGGPFSLGGGGAGEKNGKKWGKMEKLARKWKKMEIFSRWVWPGAFSLRILKHELSGGVFSLGNSRGGPATETPSLTRSHCSVQCNTCALGMDSRPSLTVVFPSQ